MNDIDKMPAKCRDCPYWELAASPWYCGNCTDRLKKPVSDFVSRQWLIDEYHRRHEGPPGGALTMIEEAPAAEVEPVRHGRWIHVPGKQTRICSRCETDEPYKFADEDTDIYSWCPHCGAKMDGGSY